MIEWDKSKLPTITKAFKSQHETTKRYLGSKTLIGDEYATINVFMENNLQAQALFKFWKNDCEHGTLPFWISLPLFGVDYDPNENDVKAMFIDDFSMSMEDLHWTNEIKLKIIEQDILYPSLTLYPSTTLYPI
jgi:hypothetical protein